MKLIIIRHGDPDYEHDSLTPTGLLQAKALVKRFSVHGLDRVYTSPLGRAKMTAAPTCEALGITPEVLEWTSENLAFRDFSIPKRDCPEGREWSFGAVRNVTYKYTDSVALGKEWYKAPPFCDCNAKEGFERIQRESDAFLSSLGYEREGDFYRVVRPNEEKVAVFCHYGFGTTWIAHLLSIVPPLFWSTFLINHSSITVIRFPNDKEGVIAPMCITLSDCSHIYEAGIPMKFENWLDY